MSQFLRRVLTQAEITAIANNAAQTTAVEGKTRNIPAAFAWAGIVPTVCQGVGNASPSESVAQYAKRVHSALIGIGEVWVDPVSGLDANAGTISSPVRTLSQACKVLSPSVINCLPGTYAPFDFRTTDAQGAKLKILRALGTCVIANAADDAATATWTADATFPNTYWMPLTPANKPVRVVLDTSRLDEEGQPTPITRYTTVTDANSSGLGYFHDTVANRLYVRYIAGANVETAVKARLRIVTGDATTKVMLLGTKMLFEGDWQLKGVYLQPLQNAGTRAILYGDFYNRTGPTVSYTISHAMDSLGADSYLQNCWFHRAQGDAYHYTDSGGLVCNGVEINCLSTYAGNVLGEPTSPNTSNGSSMHGGGNVLRINGQYRRGWGPDVVDTGTGQSWNVGTKAGPSTPSGNSFGFYTTGPVMWLDNCESQGHDQADIATTTAGVINRFALSYRTSSQAGGGGAIAAYVP